MKRLTYQEITKDNLIEIIELSNTLPEAQQQCVAPNVVSIAQGSVHSYAYYRGIYVGDKPVGFFMLSIPNEETKRTNKDNEFFLWRFMIKYDEQGNHYGSEALDHMVDIGRQLGHKELKTSCHMGDVSPYQFYINYGFVDTGTMEGGEEVLSLKIT